VRRSPAIPQRRVAPRYEQCASLLSREGVAESGSAQAARNNCNASASLSLLPNGQRHHRTKENLLPWDFPGNRGVHNSRLPGEGMNEYCPARSHWLTTTPNRPTSIPVANVCSPAASLARPIRWPNVAHRPCMSPLSVCASRWGLGSHGPQGERHRLHLSWPRLDCKLKG
jgi:hypothetical protein